MPKDSWFSTGYPEVTINQVKSVKIQRRDFGDGNVLVIVALFDNEGSPRGTLQLHPIYGESDNEIIFETVAPYFSIPPQEAVTGTAGEELPIPEGGAAAQSADDEIPL